MSGLTLGLLSLDVLTLEILIKSGTPTQRKHAMRIMPLVKRHHLLLVTLLLCNAASMEVRRSACSYLRLVLRANLCERSNIYLHLPY